MRKGFTIKKVTALFLLCVFTLGITPKKDLHALLANHKDSATKGGSSKTQQLGRAGFNCKCEDLVAESNFLAASSLQISAPNEYLSFTRSFYTSCLSFPHLFFDLRGPPLKS